MPGDGCGKIPARTCRRPTGNFAHVGRGRGERGRAGQEFCKLELQTWGGEEAGPGPATAALAYSDAAASKSPARFSSAAHSRSRRARAGPERGREAAATASAARAAPASPRRSARRASPSAHRPRPTGSLEEGPEAGGDGDVELLDGGALED